jgi:hypothetical protein
MAPQQANSKCTGTIAPIIHGMIDANAYHSSRVTWPEPLVYVVINAADEDKPVRFIDSKEAREILRAVDGVDIRHRSTAEIGNFLVRLNTHMYNKSKTGSTKDLEEQNRIQTEIKKLLNGRKREDLKDKEELRQLKDLEEKEKEVNARLDIDYKDIPSLIIVPTMDMEFAHIGGYDGELIYQEDKDVGKIFYKQYGQFPVYLDGDDVLMFHNWKLQISDIEATVASCPFRYFPLFSYDPRRHRLSTPEKGKRGWGVWDDPFARIVGLNKNKGGYLKIWLGFCMNPAIGFRPFDEYCEHLPRFYKECADKEVPILAHCVPGGFTAHGAEYYPDRTDERTDKSKERHDMILNEGLSAYQGDPLCSNMYQGIERVLDDKYDSLNYFYMNYGHPRNWIPVLEYFSNLRLCLAGFGGNSEWQLADWSNNDELPTRQWIRCIIKLTAKYDNVYADISGLNIYDEKIKNGLRKMLELIQDDKNGEFGHLKYKLIFGSGWYLTYLTDVADGGTDINGWINVRHSYSNYCSEFKNLFYTADKEGKGELWEHVSLINPQNFYALSEEKINNIHNELLNINKRDTPESQTPDESDTVSALPEEKVEDFSKAKEALRTAIQNAVDAVNNDKDRTPDCVPECAPKCKKDCSIKPRKEGCKLTGCPKDNKCKNMRIACNKGVQNVFYELTRSEELNNKLANQIYDYLATSSNFTEVDIANVQKYANEGKIIIGALSSQGGNGHVVIIAPSPIEDKEDGATGSGFWYGKGFDTNKPSSPTLYAVPFVMDTGHGRREKCMPITLGYGKKQHENVKFFKYIKTNKQ